MGESDLNVRAEYDHTTGLSQLLERVEAGEEITITRHGHPVARIIPAVSVHSVETRRAAILKMRELSQSHDLDGLKIRDMIDEGRK